MASTSLIPDTPAGSQVRWYLETLASAGRNTSAADLERFSASASIRTPFPGQGEDLIEGWRRASAAIGPFTPTAIEQNGDFSVTVMADGVNNTRRFSFRCEVEEHAPHLIKMLEYQRLLDVDVTVREASEADAAALSDLERRCPIVMGDTSMTIDRGTDYFAFTRLMEEAIVSIALVGGKVAGVNCGCYHDIRVGAKVYRTLTALHLRIDPSIRRRGYGEPSVPYFGRNTPRWFTATRTFLLRTRRCRLESPMPRTNGPSMRRGFSSHAHHRLQVHRTDGKRHKLMHRESSRYSTATVARRCTFPTRWNRSQLVSNEPRSSTRGTDS